MLLWGILCSASVLARSFETSPAWHKLDLRFQTAWREARDANDTTRNFECLIKLSSAPSKRTEKKLAKVGFKARSVIGAIITGEVAAKDAEAVATLPFVKVMELAVPLSTK